MSGIDFFYLLENNIGTYILTLFVVLCIYFILLRKWFITIFDPFVLLMIGSAFAASVVLFLKITDFISDYFFYQYLFSQFSFFIGMKLFPVNNQQSKNAECSKCLKLSKTFFSSQIIFFCFCCYSLFTIIIYYRQGIPLFMASRLGLFDKADSWGVLGRINSVSQIILFTLIFYQMGLYKHSKKELYFKYFMIAFLVITLFLSGSKSSILIPFNILFIVSFMTCVSYISFLKKYTLWIISAFVLFALFVIVVQESQGEGGALLYFLHRLVAFGDVYYQAYVNDIIYQIQGDGIAFAFYPFLKTFRIMTDFPPAIGNQIFEIMTSSDLNAGPNARINVLSFVLFGYYGSIVFSFLVGGLTGYIRNVLSLKVGRNVLSLSICSYIYMQVLSFEKDFSLSINELTSLIIFIGFASFFLFTKQLHKRCLNEEIR